MKKNSNIKNTEFMKKRIVTLSKLLVLFLIIGSSIAMADTGSSEQDKSLDVQKNAVDQTAASPSLESAPENPDFINYQNNKASFQREESLDGRKAGVIPSPVDFSHLSSVSTIKASFPAYYDLRTLNKVTPVKDQGSAGTCWAFTTYGSLESGLKPGETWDFSENNIKNLLSSSYSEGFDRDANDGATHLQSTAYLARWSGPVDESDDPYDPSSVSSPQNLPVKKHVQKVLFIPNRQNSLDNDIIKQAVQNYGGIYTTMYYGSSYYSPNTYSYYYNGTIVLNHAVTIVGWNDSYDKNKFSTVPPGDGAFIVKNSWGTDWGDNGYFYVSYYDSKIGKDNAVFTAETTNNYENIYQYDPLGWVSSVGYSNPTAWCANIFTAKSNEALKAVSFYTTDSNCNYQIYIYTDPSSGPINQSGPVLTKSGTATFAGYNTIPLGSEIKLTSGQNFSIALKLTNSAYNYPIAMERPISAWSSKAKSNASESFISYDGNGWTDITVYYPNTNMCIKAFTDPINAKLPVANFSTNVSNGYAPLTVQFTDFSEGATGWNWNFGDGANSIEQNPIHIYSAAGNYTANLTVSNENGTASKLATINVSAKPVLPVFPGYTNPPTDPNHDGLYEDVNGNGMMDFDDVVAYYDNMDWIGENAQIDFFDYNKNSLIDFDDVVKLYDML